MRRSYENPFRRDNKDNFNRGKASNGVAGFGGESTKKAAAGFKTATKGQKEKKGMGEYGT